MAFSEISRWLEGSLFPSSFRVQLKSLETQMTGTEIDLVSKESFFPILKLLRCRSL
jgi:hypothetical protein